MYVIPVRNQVRRATTVALAMLTVIISAGCTLTSTPPTSESPSPARPTVAPTDSPAVGASTSVTLTEITMNVGGGIGVIPSGEPAAGGPAAIVNKADIGLKTQVMVTLPSPCASDVLSPTLVARLPAGDYSVNLVQIDDERFRAAIAAADPAFSSFYDKLCDDGTTASLIVNAICPSGNVTNTIGTLACGDVLLGAELVDPRGHVDLPNSNGVPGCHGVMGIEATLHKISGNGLTPGDATCKFSSTGGWHINAGASPSSPLILGDVVASANTLMPPLNPQTTSGDGLFAWNAPDGCYYVRFAAFSGTSYYCVWHTETFGVDRDHEIIGLDFTIQGILPCAALSAPSPCATPTF